MLANAESVNELPIAAPKMTSAIFLNGFGQLHDVEMVSCDSMTEKIGPSSQGIGKCRRLNSNTPKLADASTFNVEYNCEVTSLLFTVCFFQYTSLAPLFTIQVKKGVAQKVSES